MKPSSVVILACVAALAGTVGLQAQDREADREAVRKADLDFYEAVKARSRERFLGFIDDEAAFFGGERRLGPVSIAEGWAPFFEADGPTLSWAPETVAVVGAGDLAYTSGRYELASKGADGKPHVSRGTYLTVWRKQADGSWKAVVDIGSADRPAPKP